MKALKIRTFNLDSNLGFMIQQITNDSSQEILSYFYGISTFVVDDISKHSKAQWLCRDVILYYKETPIIFRIRISGPGPGRSDNLNLDISVSFPNEDQQFDVAHLMNSIVESGLELSSECNTIPKFKRPELKTPKCLKDIRIKQDEERLNNG